MKNLMSIFVFVLMLFHNHLWPTKDINQVDIATNIHPGNNVTARIKDDERTAKPTPSIEEKKKRSRDPNKHYISGMWSPINHSVFSHLSILNNRLINDAHFHLQHHHHQQQPSCEPQVLCFSAFIFYFCFVSSLMTFCFHFIGFVSYFPLLPRSCRMILFFYVNFISHRLP